MKRNSLSRLLALLAIPAVSSYAGRAQGDETPYAHRYAAPTSTRGEWDYRKTATHGLKECGFSVLSDPDAGVNGGVLSGTAPNLRIAAQEGHEVRLVLICRRAYSNDAQGIRTIGPEVTYSGPNGEGTPIGQEWPGDPTVRGAYPRGRMWVVTAGLAGYETTHTIKGGSDVLNVTIVPQRAPVNVLDVAAALTPTAKIAEEAHQAALRDYQDRMLTLTFGYVIDPTSVGKGDVTQGVTSDLEVLVGPRSEVKASVGVTGELTFRQIPVTTAPNPPPNGRNGYVAQQRLYIGPTGGVSWMPHKNIELSVKGGLGGLVAMRSTAPVSQLADRQLYISEPKTVAALALRATVCVRVVIDKHFLLGPCAGIQGNLTPLPTAIGPELGTDGKLIRREGQEVNGILSVNAGFQF